MPNDKSKIRNVDERIVQEVEQLLIQKLRDLPDDSAITQRYGKFQRLSEVRWNRPNYAWMLIVRLDFSAMAHFEKAQARLGLNISKATPETPDEPPEIPDWSPSETSVKLKMTPSPEWMHENPKNVGEFKIIDGVMWMIKNGQLQCTIDGWAYHPDFLYE